MSETYEPGVVKGTLRASHGGEEFLVTEGTLIIGEGGEQFFTSDDGEVTVHQEDDCVTMSRELNLP